MGEETAQFGWCALASMLGKSKRTCMRRKKELKNAGIILYTNKRNSSGYTYKAMYFFPAMVKAYLVRKSLKDEIF